MGKREVFILAGFIVIGVVVYQFTAPPPTGESSFSFANWFGEVRRDMRGNPGRAELTQTVTLPLEAAHREVRIQRIGRAVSVIGEDRTDIEYTYTVTSTGPDDETAKAYAERTVLERDDVADSLVLRVDYPAEGTQETALIIKVPSSMNVRVENANGVTMTDIAGAHIEAARGAVTLSNITGAVNGSHQDGAVTVTNAGVVKMRLTRLRSKFENVTGPITLDVRDGECDILNSGGATEIDSLRATLTLTNHRGEVIVRGNDGRVTLEAPLAESRVDMRRTEVEVTLTGAVPVTIVTTDQTARVIIKDSAQVALDAGSTDGRIQAADVNLTPVIDGNNSSLVHTFGTGSGARVTVRNTRGEIVIRK